MNHLIKNLTYFKSSSTSCVYKFYANKKASFFNSSTVEAGTFDHYSLFCTMLHSTFCKGSTKLLYYRSYNNCNNEEFENILKQRLLSSSNFE